MGCKRGGTEREHGRGNDGQHPLPVAARSVEIIGQNLHGVRMRRRILGANIVDGINQGAVSSYVFSNVTANHTIRATFLVNVVTITSFTPTSGNIGASVTIKGIRFTGATSVKFNGTAVASYTVSGDTQITTTVPTGVTTGTLSVTTSCGTGTSGNSFTIPTYTLTITITGSGTVAKSPNQSSYPGGSSVTLTASPSKGWSFVGWSGDYSGATSPVTIVMNANKTINARFTNQIQKPPGGP